MSSNNGQHGNNVYSTSDCTIEFVPFSVLPNEDDLARYEEFKNLVSSWGLSQKTIHFLVITHECTIKTLQVMGLDCIDEMFENYPKGEKFIFKEALRKWRLEMNNPLPESNVTRSLNSRVLEWIENQSSTSSPIQSGSFFAEHSVRVPVGDKYNILAILEKSIKGRLVIDYYNCNDLHLDSKHRQYLIHCIIDHYMSLNIRLHSADFEILSKNISNIFKSEYPNEYYSPRQGKKKQTGKLVDRYSNQCYGTKFLKLSTNTINQSLQTTSTTDCFTSETYLENRTWLKSNIEPWSLVCEKWQESANVRTTEFTLSINKNIAEFLTEWPSYKHHLGYELIDIDFEFKFQQKSEIAKSKIDRLINTCPLILEPLIKDKQNRNLLKDLTENTNLNEDARDMISCLLLHAVIQPKRISQKYKPTITDAQEDFVIFLQNINELEGKLEQIKQKGFTLQPKIVVIGTKWEKLDEIFITYEGIKYKCEYSVLSKEVWYFLQEFLFDIDSKHPNIKKYLGLFE